MIALTALTIAGCGGDSNSNASDVQATTPVGSTVATGGSGYPKGYPTKTAAGKLLPPPVQIFGGGNAANTVGSDTLDIVRSNRQYEQLQNQVFANDRKRPPLPGTDFKHRMIVAVFLKPAADGAQVQVSELHEKPGKLTVTAVKVLPGAGCAGATRTTHPYNIIEAEKVAGTAVLKVKTQKGTPCT